MMINTMPKQPSDSLLMQKTADNTLQLSPPLFIKGDGKIEATLKGSRPWKVTPPLKKRHVRLEANPDTIKISPLKVLAAKKATLVKPTKKNSVRFSKVIKSRALKKERTTDLTPEARQAMWYNNREYAAIDQDSLRNIQALQQVRGELACLPATTYCMRGLEMKASPHIHRLRRLRAAITVRAVLDQQAYQRRMLGNGCDLVGESMAMLSRRYTLCAQIRARELGLIDSLEASR